MIANSICFTPCYAAVLIWPVSISSCVVRPLSVVCISLSCCAADFVCCLCTAAAACILLYIVRLLRPVLLIRGCPCFRFAFSVVIWLLPKPHSVLYGCHGFGLWLRGGFCMLCCGGLMEAGFLRYGLASGMRGCASAVRFFALLLHALLFFRSFPHFLLYPTSYFSVVALCARLCAQPRFPPFFSPLSLSSRSFLSSRYLCALFLADGFLPLTS